MGKPWEWRVVDLLTNQTVCKGELQSLTSHGRLYRDAVVLVVGCAVVIHDLATGDQRATLPSPHRKNVAAMGQHGKYALTLSIDAVLKIWDTDKEICVGDVVVDGAKFEFGYPYYVAA